MSYGKRLKEIRSSLRLTQQNFAEDLQIKNKQTISDTENGRQNELPSYAETELAKRYNINLDWLKNGVGDKMLPGDHVAEENVVYGKLPADIETIVDILKDMDTKKRRFALKAILDISGVA